MPRIRTVKPEFYAHEQLNDLEEEFPALRPMLVFSGLWGHCDKEGRFEWRPRTLKRNILPFVTYDINATLSLLKDHDFIRYYEVDGKPYGYIPTFKEHQRISGKEALAPAVHPTPGSNGEAPVKHQVRTREKPEKQQGSQEGKGRERNTTAGCSPAMSPSGSSKPEYPPDFEAIWQLYPRRNGDNPKRRALRAYHARLDDGHTFEEMRAGVERYAAWVRATGKEYTETVKQAATFFGPDKPFLEAWALPQPKPQNPLYTSGKAVM